jgi:hypothetical protein
MYERKDNDTFIRNCCCCGKINGKEYFLSLTQGKQLEIYEFFQESPSFQKIASIQTDHPTIAENGGVQISHNEKHFIS